MRDNLDLHELRERAEFYITQSRRIRNRSLIFVLGALITLVWIHVQHQNPIGAIYSRQADGWEIIIDDAPIDIQTSTDGSTWIHTLYSEKMIHVSGIDGREYWDSDLDDCCFDFEGQFAVYGETVWAENESNLAYYDGSSWSVTNQYFPTTNLIDLAVNSQGVFAIDENYRLYVNNRFDEWETTVDLSSIAASSSVRPTLISINNVMYLHLGGLRRFDGEQWDKISQFVNDGVFVGQTDTRIWIQTSSAVLVSFNVELNELEFYTAEQLGISSDTRIQNVFNGNRDELYFATSTTINRLSNDSRSWEVIESVDTLHGINHAEILSDGRLIVLSTNLGLAFSASGSTYHLIHLVMPILLPILIIAVFIFIWNKNAQKANAIRTERSRKLISALIADFEVDEEKIVAASKSSSSFVFRLIGGFIVAMIIPVVLINVGLPPQINSLLGYIIFLGILFFPYLRRVLKFSDQSEETQRLRRWGLRLTAVGILFVLAIPVVESIVHVVLPDFENPMFLLLAVYFVGLGGFIIYRRRKPSQLLPKSLAQVDYDKAVKDVRKTDFISIQLLNVGSVHTYASQYETASNVYLQALRELQASNPSYLSTALVGLAYAIDRLGKLDEALRMYEAAVVIFPENQIPYQAIVNSYNDNQVYPERALELSNEMMKIVGRKRFSSIVQIEGNSIYKLTHALALANAGQFEGVELLIEQAHAEYEWDFLPGRAKFYHMQARILLAMNDVDRAKELLNKAIEIDPNGDNGKLAQKFLQQLS